MLTRGWGEVLVLSAAHDTSQLQLLQLRHHLIDEQAQRALRVSKLHAAEEHVGDEIVYAGDIRWLVIETDGT
jgi:hypothetical protein